MLKRKWRVRIDKQDGAWWFRLQWWYDGDLVPAGWITYMDGYHSVAWRLTPSLFDGIYIVPQFWFKTLQERIKIAVSWAVDAVVRAEGLDKRSIEADRIRRELNEMATKMFDEALAEAIKEKEGR